MEDTIIDIISEHLGVDAFDCHLDSKLSNDLGADSLDGIEILMTLEDEFDIILPEDLLHNDHTVSDVVNMVKKEIQKMKRVQLYTNNAECINCKALKKELDSAGIEYGYSVVSYNEIIELANKYNHPSIPICLFDGSVVFGDANTVVKEIQRLEND